MKIGNKISLAFLVTAIILTSVAASFFYVIARNNLIREIFAHLETTARLRAHHIETTLEGELETLRLISSRTQLRISLEEYNKSGDIADKEKMERILLDAKSSIKGIRQISIMNLDGEVIVSTDTTLEGTDYSDETFFIEGKERDNLFLLPAGENDAVIYLSGPLLLENKLLGVLVTVSSSDNIFDATLDRTGLGETGEVYLVNGDGYMITPSRFKQNVLFRQKVDTVGTRMGFEITEKPEQKKHLYEPLVYADYRGINVLGVHDHIHGTDWLLMAEIDEKEALAPLTIIRNFFIAILIVVPLLAWLIGFYVSRIISKPIYNLRKGTEMIGRGDLDHKVGTDAKDEIGQLSRAFDKMTENLKKTTTSRDELAREVRERIKLEQSLLESEKRYKSLFNEALDMIHIVDTNGRIIDANETELRIMGYPREEYIGKPLIETVHPDYRENTKKALEKVLSGKEVKGYETIIVTKGGKEITIEVSAVPRIEDGKVVAARGILRDITTRKKAEEKIKVAAEEWERTFDSISDLVFIQDKDFTITKANKAFAEALKLKPEDIVGKKCYEIVHNRDVPWPTCPFEKTKLDKKAITEEVDDPYIGYPLLITTSPIFDDKGEVVGSVHIAKDISERKKVEQLKDEFVNTVSHELRAPLAIIKESMYLIASKAIDEKQKKHFDIATRNVDRLDRLINDVLDYQKLVAGKMEFKMNPENINDLVKAIKKEMMFMAEDKKLSFTVRLEEDLPKVEFDRDRITQVLMNLINNAIKFTAEGGIEITTARTEEGVSVSVKDTGIGIKKEDIAKLFQSFTQIAEARKVSRRGTGLGLAISRKIIEEHGGRIWVESKYGKSSTFSFFLPARE
ncbi:MAG: PAS domain S-box protein [Candidatus Omnitrophota bacterium]